MDTANKDCDDFGRSVFRILRRACITPALLVASIALNGCSSGLGLWPVAQSHITAEGAQIVPLGDTKGTASDFFFSWGGLPDFLHSNLQAEAVQEAIRAKQGDLLIHYTLSVRATRLPLGLLVVDLSLWWVTWTAEGIAAKILSETPQSVADGRESRPAPPEMISQ
ncbi:hypothetical protein [Nitrospira sp. Nam80]